MLDWAITGFGMNIQIRFKRVGTLKQHIARFDHEPSVPTMKEYVAKQLGMNVAETHLYDDRRHGIMFQDDERVPANAKVCVRTMSSARKLPTLGDVPRVRDVCPEDAGGGDSMEAVKDVEDEDDTFGGDVFVVVPPDAAAQQANLAALVAMAALDADRLRIGRYSCVDGQAGNAVVGKPVRVRRLPTGVCMTCGLRGHWQSDCPALDDPRLIAKRLHHPSGIPVEMLLSDSGGGLVASDGKVCLMQARDGAFLAATAGYRPLPEDPRFESMRKIDALLAAGDAGVQILARMPSAFISRGHMSFADFEMMFYECDGPSWCADVLKASRLDVVKQ